MSKDFNIYKWRRDYLAESVSREEQEDLFAKGWIKDIEPEAGDNYTHIIRNAPEKQLDNIKNVAKKAGYDYVDHNFLPIGSGNKRIEIYFTEK